MASSMIQIIFKTEYKYFSFSSTFCVGYLRGKQTKLTSLEAKNDIASA